MTQPTPEILINGEKHPLRLTLGALATIEKAVGDGDFEKLTARLQRPSVSDLILILHALVGGGGKDIAIEVLRASDVDLGLAASAISEAFKAMTTTQSLHTDEAPE